MEEIYLGVYERDGPNEGTVFFIGAEHLDPREVPSSSTTLTFEDVERELAVLFKARNRKLKVQGMP